jgi:hypothetical protein
VPQLTELPLVSTQEPAHAVSVPAHPDAHLPSEHTVADPHAFPQAPQFFASEEVSTHAPEHVDIAVAQPHAPF